MSASWTPFLYQTRTLQRVWRAPAKARVTQLAQSSFRGYQTRRSTNDDTDADSIPFDWGVEGKPDLSTWQDDQDPEDPEGPTPLTPNSTITPTEAYAFRRIFDEISTGKMPTPKKRRFPGTGTDAGAEEPQASTAASLEPSRSIVEQARMNDFRSSVLSRFPEDLRNAAHLALGIYETKSGTDYEVQEETMEQQQERLKYEQQREDEKARVERLMSGAESDLELWEVMEAEVFSLPQKLGILEEETKTTGRGKGKKQSPQQKLRKGETLLGRTGSDAVGTRSSSTRGGQKHNIAVHGPLYTHFLSHGLTLFATSFRRPSPFAFQILPRAKELGLPSYVLGVSSRFYAALARMHWEQFGNAGRALDIIEEMNAAGLYANYDVKELLGRLRSEIVTCSSNEQGQLTQAVMDMPPFDGELLDRLDEVEENCMRPMSHLDE